MKLMRNKQYTHAIVFLVFVVMAGLFGGCRSMPLRDNAGLTLVPFAGSSAANMSARQVLEVGSRVGLDREQILEYGPPLRNAIAEYGACRFYKNQRVHMIMAVQNKKLYVSMHTGATFIYDLKGK